MKKYAYILFFLVHSFIASGQVSVDAQLDSTQIRIGEQTHLSLTVIAPEGSKVELPAFKPQTEITKGIEIIASKQETEPTEKGETRKVVYTLTAWDESKTEYELPEMSVKVDGRVYKSPATKLKIKKMPVDSLQMESILPPDSIQDNPFAWQEWIPYGISTLLILVLSWVLWKLFKQLKTTKTPTRKQEKAKVFSPYEKACIAIMALKQRATNTEECQKAYYTELTDILRTYIAACFGINAMEMTSNEIIENLQKNNQEVASEELRQLLQAADLVKFARYNTAENEKTFYTDTLTQFIEATKMQPNEASLQVASAPKPAEEKTKQHPKRLLRILIMLCTIAIAGLLTLTIIGIWDLIE